MSRPTQPQFRLLHDMAKGLRLTGYIRWRTGGKRSWRLFEVKPMRVPTADRTENWNWLRDVPEATVLACEKHGWVEKVPTTGTAIKEMRLTDTGRAVLEAK